MESRVRTKTRTESSGATYQPTPGNWGWVKTGGPFPYTSLDWRCEDFIGKARSPLTGRLPPSGLFLRKTEFIPAKLNFIFTSNLDGKFYGRFDQIPGAPVGAYDLDPPSPGWQGIEGSTTELVTKLLTLTNPFEPVISVPILVAELLEATSLLKLAVNNVLTLAGSAWLNWKFGWEQTIRDIQTLASITESIEARVRDFNILAEKGVLRKVRRLASGGVSVPEWKQAIYSAPGGSWDGKCTRSFRTKVWGSVHWVPSFNEQIDLSKLATFNEACKVVLGLRSPTPSDVWELIPFSWLIDYFANIGEVLRLAENAQVIPQEICIMRNRRVDTYVSPDAYERIDYYDRKIYSGTAGRLSHNMLLREVVTPPSGMWNALSFSFMSKTQTANLMALLYSLARHRK